MAFELGDAVAGPELEQRDAAVRVLGEEGGRARLAPVDVQLDALEGDVEKAQEEADLVAVPRGEIVVKAKHCAHLTRPLPPRVRRPSP